MARLLTINEICERSLRQIGATGIRSRASRPEEMQEARYWLDMVMAHTAARHRSWWLVPATGVFPLTPGQASYTLDQVIAQAGSDGVMNGIEAFLFDLDTGLDIEDGIKLLRRQEYEEILDKNRQAQPTCAYIDRSNTPVMTFYPVPPAGRNLEARLLFQTFGSDMTKNLGIDQTYRLRRSWNLYLVTALSAQLADGPVRKLPADEVKDLKDSARTLLNQLEDFDGQEQADEPRRTRYFDGV